jgi:uncharacterized protein (TIGR03643 family)
MPELTPDDIDRIIGMAWEDRTPFEAIEHQFGVTPDQVKVLMRTHMKPSSYRMWRIRMERISTKHQARRGFLTGRFRSNNQKSG